MSRIKLKNGGGRKKAIFGADGALMAAATIAAAGMNVAATTKAAKDQAKSITDSAKTQADALLQQNENNTNLQKESIEFTRSQNAENRQQQQDIQMTLQQLAGQQNMNDRLEANKKQLKAGGRVRRKLKKSSLPFEVTDGGGVLPIDIDNNGYGLYELYGNDHEHYHKTKGGKNKTGVGIKFENGGVVEGEGNQNSNTGELLYVTPDDALFLSKHSIKGFNPREAVMNGVHPEEAFAYQENIKDAYGINDDGSKAKTGTRRKLKKAYGGFNVLNYNQFPFISTDNIATGVAYAKKNNVAKYGKRVKAVNGFYLPTVSTFQNNALNFGKLSNPATVNMPKTLSLKSLPASTNFSGGGSKFGNFFNNYGGAIINGGANLLGSAISMIGNNYANKVLGKAYNQAGETMADAYRRLQTIDDDFLNAEDYYATHSMAVVRDANTNINPQLERIRRNAASEIREINRNTNSAAARQQRIAATNDRAYQRMGEQFAYKNNMDEQIKQGNAERITQVAQANADRDVQAKRDYIGARLSLKQYNNDIVNQRIAGEAQSYADAMTQIANNSAQTSQANMSSLASAIGATGQAFGQVFDANRVYNQNLDMVMFGADTASKVDYAIQLASRGNKNLARNYYKSFANSSNPEAQKYAERLRKVLI